MGKIAYLDDLQQMQADHIWGKVRKMRKQKGVGEYWMPLTRRENGVPVLHNKGYPYGQYHRKVAARFAGRAGRVAQQLIMIGDY